MTVLAVRLAILRVALTDAGVARIIGCGTGVQVVWAYATAIITVMADVKAFRYRSDRVTVREAVGQFTNRLLSRSPWQINGPIADNHVAATKVPAAIRMGFSAFPEFFRCHVLGDRDIGMYTFSVA